MREVEVRVLETILSCGRGWKEETKGVITYTPKSDMTIHLGVVAAKGGRVRGGGRRPLDGRPEPSLSAQVGWFGFPSVSLPWRRTGR